MHNNPHSENEFAQYRIRQLLSGGPEEELYLVEDADKLKYFAKRSTVLFRNDSKRNAIILQEDEALSQLNIPGIPHVHEIVNNQNEAIPVYSRYDGEGLDIVLKYMLSSAATISTEVRLSIIRQFVDIALSLEACQLALDSRPINIRVDFRPSSIFLTADGQCHVVFVSLLDPPFLHNSIARIPHPDYIAYAAPEQVNRGIAPDYRAGYFGLGALIFLLATGKPLFHNTTSAYNVTMARRKSRCMHPFVSDGNPELACLNGPVNILLGFNPSERLNALNQLKSTLNSHMADIAIERQFSLLKNLLADATTHSAEGWQLSPALSGQPDRLSNIAD